MDSRLLDEIIESLADMIYYADDGVVSRTDPDFKEFYDKVDKARALLERLENLNKDLLI